MATKTTPSKGPAKAAPAAKPRSAAKAAAAQKTVKPPVKAAAQSKQKTPAKPAAPTTVTLKQLAAGIAERQGMPKKQADIVLADVFGQLVNHLKAGERVRIGGLGIIEVKDRPARMGRNPATGEAIQVKASRKVAFRVAKDLKDAI